MDFMLKQLEYTDCMLQAIYNAATATGKKVDYKKLKAYAEKQGWYTYGKGMCTSNMAPLGKKFGVEFHRIESIALTRAVKDRVMSGRPVMILIPPHYMPAGHGMVAIKGEKGVRMLGSYYGKGTGWKMFCKRFNKELWRLAIEAYEVRSIA